MIDVAVDKDLGLDPDKHRSVRIPSSQQTKPPPMVDRATDNDRAVRPAEIGVIHGRFQILHNDHLKYLMAAVPLCRHLVIGITNPDPFMTRPEETNPERNSGSANPLTYYERHLLVRAAMRESGVRLDQFTVTPFPINLPDRYQYYVPIDAVFFLTIYDDWGRRKLSYFQSLNLKTHVMWEVSPDQKGISAKDIRERMLSGGDWRGQVPASVARLLLEWDIPSRLRKMAAKENS
jgi:nicotinamide mononucleotide adenylyltransferase